MKFDLKKNVSVPAWGLLVGFCIVILCLSFSLFMGVYMLTHNQRESAVPSGNVTVATGDGMQDDSRQPTGETNPQGGLLGVIPGDEADSKAPAAEGTDEVPTDNTPVPDGRVEQLLAEMSVEDKVYQMFIVTPEALVNNEVSCVTVSGETTKKYIEQRPVGGVIYFTQNLEDTQQTTDMISKLQEYAGASNDGIGLFIAVDEEGGRVARAASKLGTTKHPAMSFFGDGNDPDAPQAVYDAGADIAQDIRQFGFNLDFAPVADVNIDPNNELGDRIFSSDPQLVSDLSAQFVKGLQDNGVSATLKHFPGLGAANANTHNSSFVRINRTIEELRAEEFKAFKGGVDAGSDFIMLGHQIVSAAGDETPSSMSAVVVGDWLRGELGYQGIIVTDAQNMGAITQVYTSEQAAVKAIQAGVDVVLMPADFQSAYNGVLSAVKNGTIPEERLDESVRRILTVKEKHGLI